MDENNLYMLFKRKGTDVLAFGLTKRQPDPENVGSFFEAEDPSSTPDEVDEDLEIDIADSFETVATSFESVISMYRDAVLTTVKISPLISKAISAANLIEFAQSRGLKIEGLSTTDIDVFELPPHAVSSAFAKIEEAKDATNGARHLPQIVTIGLISSYDSMLSELLRIVFSKKPEIVFTSDREIKFSDLASYASIEDARAGIISEEIEGALRKSHHDQFQWMENKFSMRLREGLNVWPDFIELCERRNLFTHTGGLVSGQYVKNCIAHGHKTTSQPGDRLAADVRYLSNSIEVVAEIGLKLIHTLWRKFSEDDRQKADACLNSCGLSLIQKKKYNSAQKILEFGADQKKHSSDSVRRMMVVNLANALKLAGKKSSASNILNKEDWTATSTQFRICVAAVKDDRSTLCELLALGPKVTEISASNFRDWPVFETAHKFDDVAETFESTYGEPLFKINNSEAQYQARLDIHNEGDEQDGHST